MTFPLLPDYQLFLLPARTAQEASAWGSAAMAYAAFFPDVHFARDPARVDWRGYSHVTIVHPAFWPDDLIVQIKQANPRAVIDLIPVTAPEILQTVLNVRLSTGLRYGPQREFDWTALWPAGRCLVGLHGRADGELEEPDYAVVRAARVEAVKLTSDATAESIRRLREIDPEVFVLVRAFLPFGAREQPRLVSPREFFALTEPNVVRLVDAGARYVELHNEPNLRSEGLGGSWSDGRTFGAWFLEALDLFRQRLPEARFGFPGLSPGPQSEAAGRADSEVFIAEAADAARQADWIGVHAYWVDEREITDDRNGFGFTRYRERFPEQLLFITEFGNPAQPKPVVAAQYARYYAALRRVPGLGAAFAYVVSTSNPEESARWAWRDEAGQDLGLAAAVARRQFDDATGP